jgi:hypothetical protein
MYLLSLFCSFAAQRSTKKPSKRCGSCEVLSEVMHDLNTQVLEILQYHHDL